MKREKKLVYERNEKKKLSKDRYRDERKNTVK